MKGHLLVVEQSSAEGFPVSDYLRISGFAVLSTPDGNEAISHLGNGVFDLVLIDGTARGIDAYGLCRKIRAKSDDNGIPLMVVTSPGSQDARFRSMEPGSVDFVAKPFRGIDIEARILGRIYPLHGPDTERGDSRIAEIEERLARSISERDSLLREIHHRVKNNLSVVCSLLRVEADSITSPERAMVALAKTLDRIMAIALVHDCVYECGDCSRIDLEEYVGKMVPRILQENQCSESVRWGLSGTKVVIDADKAIPVGIILNELVVNSCEHAFRGRTGGAISIALGRSVSKEIELLVMDDGPGLTPDDLAKKTLGLPLAHLMATQIDGVMEAIGESGAGWRISFPEYGACSLDIPA